MLRIVKLVCIDDKFDAGSFSVGTTYQGSTSDTNDCRG